MDLRRETVQQLTARLLLLGWSVSKIARRLHCIDRAVRWRMKQPESQALFDAIQQEHFKTVDRRLGALRHGACDALERLLKHSDWRARDAALAHLFKVHGKYVEKFDVTGTLSGQVRHVDGVLLPPGEAMTDEMRTKARELLQMQRQMFQRSLPARFASHDPDDLDDCHDTRDPLNGRFTTSEHNPHEDQ
jgi:AraC-like DNA-binding protein